MELFNSLLSWVIKKRIHQIELFQKYPHDVQNEWFRKLVHTAKDTEWGKRYDYKSIKTPADYQERVPINDYEGFKATIMRLKQGEQNLLWPTEINWFAKSSGTTSEKSKFLPVSKESLEDCHYNGGKDLLCLHYHNVPDSIALSGRGLSMGGSSSTNPFRNDSYTGDLSAIIIKNLPLWAELIRTPNMSVALMPEWEEKIEKMARITMKQNITNLSGVPSWNLVLIKRVLELTGKRNLCEVWPNLSLFAHGGVSFRPYREQFKQLVPSDKMHYVESYNASEGYIGIQDTDDPELLLMLDYGIYYEFMPMEEFGKDHPKTLTLDQVELNQNYALVISTNAGLWRYLIGDTVKFTSLDPYRIVVTGRTKHYINAFGEELIIENAEQALEVACSKTGAVVKEYTACPVYMDGTSKGGHEWLIEFAEAPTSLDYFGEVLDNALKSLNSDYEAKRYKSLALEAPRLRVLPEGAFFRWMKQRGKLGGQNKVPRLANNRDYVDSILQLLDREQPKKSIEAS